MPLPRTRRVDYEYERAGTTLIFMFYGSLSSWRRGDGPQAQDEGGPGGEVASLLEDRYADCEKITLVCDNLNTHAPGAFYEASCAGAGVGQASRCAPKHGSWLNFAENEFRTRQCLRHRRLGDLETLRTEAWSVDVNERQRGVANES